MNDSFTSLSYQSQVRRMAGLARTALSAYPLPPARLRLLAHLWNTTFRMLTADGEQYMLRVHHPGQTSTAAVRSELLWLAALRREIGLPAPEPVLNRAGELVTVAEQQSGSGTRLCVLFRWVEGRFLYRGLTPAHLRQVGELMARLQEHAAGWQRPAGFTRHRVDNLDPMVRDREDAFDEAVADGLARKVASVTDAAAGAVMAAAIRGVWAVRREMGESPDRFGLIHADLHHGNFMFHGGAAGAIDFDDCGFGHWLYDLAVPITALQRHPRCSELRHALLLGYRQRRPLPAEDEIRLDAFIALRRIQDVVGVIDERDHPDFRGTWKAQVLAELRELERFAAAGRY